MGKLTLVIMAAGMGSRYGGLKQIDPVDKAGHIIMDFSIHDALKAGFEKVVFVIKKENEADFREAIGDRIAEKCETVYAFQELTNVPEGYEVPADRVKPWGTGHALLSCKDVVDGPCAVINADDFYGAEAFRIVADYLRANPDDDKERYVMAGFLLKNTLTEFGSVARGVCETTEEGYLKSVTERTRIEKKADGPAFTEDDGATYTSLPEDTIVSMNMWGFHPSIFKELDAQFAAFLDKALVENPLKGEYYLPGVVSNLLAADKATVKVEKTTDQWYGVTYRDDKPKVSAALEAMEEAGL
ncbi:MAG: nucleotidyltransferase, partial [Lachnospiraceae bacterium]|nr:nucleotidyltransferase [Candidatus Equihabitans merdae]